MPSTASHHSRRISLAPRALGSIRLRRQYQRSASGAGTPCPREMPVRVGQHDPGRRPGRPHALIVEAVQVLDRQPVRALESRQTARPVGRVVHSREAASLAIAPPASVSTRSVVAPRRPRHRLSEPATPAPSASSRSLPPAVTVTRIRDLGQSRPSRVELLRRHVVDQGAVLGEVQELQAGGGVARSRRQTRASARRRCGRAARRRRAGPARLGGASSPRTSQVG